MKEVARVLYGSQNYGLDSVTSDRDYKVLLCPDWDDLYNMRKVSKGDLAEGYDSEHESPMDCRQFDSLLLKGNVNVLEMVFSAEWQYNDELREYIMRAQLLLSHGYLALVWPQFYAAVEGMALNSLHRYGANSKPVSRSWYLYQLMYDVWLHGFSMTTDSWRGKWYTKEARELRLGPKVYTTEEYQMVADQVLADFKQNKVAFATDAKKWVEAHSSKVKYLKSMASDLSALMTNFVLHELIKELNLV